MMQWLIGKNNAEAKKSEQIRERGKKKKKG